MKTPRTAPWKRDKPPGKSIKLTPEAKAAAKAAAERAGRRYPNLIDNMRAAKLQKRTPLK